MFPEHEKFKNIAAGFQSLVLAIAIVIGGGWTIFTFQRLRQSEMAEAKLRAELNELREKRVINIVIKASQTIVPHDTTRYIRAIVEITNVGNYSEVLEWQGPPFRVRRVLFGNQGTLKFGPPTGAVMAIACAEDAGNEVLPGEIVRLPCVARVRDPGLYYITFTVFVSEAAQSQTEREGGSEPVAWSSATLVTVE